MAATLILCDFPLEANVLTWPGCVIRLILYPVNLGCLRLLHQLCHLTRPAPLFAAFAQNYAHKIHWLFVVVVHVVRYL